MRMFTTCVGYADYLAVTLPPWKRIGIPHVITKLTDQVTQSVCLYHDVECLVTDAWDTNGSDINKGAAQQQVISTMVDEDEPIILFDADCVPVQSQPLSGIQRFQMLGCHRFQIDTHAELARYDGQWDKLKEIPTSTIRPHLTRGYFQHFRYRCDLRFHNNRHTTFSGCDMHLASQFHTWRVEDPTVFYVLHLGKPNVNWKGRVTPPWR